MPASQLPLYDGKAGGENRASTFQARSKVRVVLAKKPLPRAEALDIERFLLHQAAVTGPADTGFDGQLALVGILG